MKATEFQEQTVTELERISWLSARDPSKEFCSLMHHFNVESLKACFNKLDGKKAVGTDRINKEEYGENLIVNLEELITKMKRMAYRPQAVRQVLIPKEGKPNAKRPLGISNFEDKLVQKRMQELLESIYEPIFLNCSYGFRPNKGCHDAIKALDKYLYKNEVKIVIDVDLENFFGTINHEVLENILREKIKDTKLMRYIIRMFKAGMLDCGELKMSDEGVQQGSCCSPVLANIFAHYVIDKWFEEEVKSHTSQVEMFRYADDIIICCNKETDANRIKEALSKRLAKYGLKLNEDKTKLVKFSKAKYRQEIKQGCFDFLGFTFYLGKTRKGGITPKMRTSGKRMRAKLKRVNTWARMVRNKYLLTEIWKKLYVKLRGHIQYYGVTNNSKYINRFIHRVKRIMFKWLNRRSQRRSFTWEKFELFVKRKPLPKVKIVHSLF